MDSLIKDVPFNNKRPDVMHIDINSCFATIEQQANPLLRGKPIGVAAAVSEKSIIVAPSIESKKLGISVGHRVFEARKVIPNIIILPPDPPKYRYIHLRLKDILQEYT